MENHIAHIERFGDVHIGTHAVLDNRQPPEDSEYRSESLPALMMDNTKPGIYQHLRFHLDSDDVYVDCFVHEENLGVLLSGDEGDVRFLDALFGEPFECFSGVGGLDDEDWDMADGWDDLELGQGPRTEIHYLFGASPETVEHFTSERLERLDYGGGTKELFVTVGFDNGQQHVYLAPYSAGMKGYREMLQIASEQVEEYLRQKDLDISDLDVETDKQL